MWRQDKPNTPTIVETKEPFRTLIYCCSCQKEFKNQGHFTIKSDGSTEHYDYDDGINTKFDIHYNVLSGYGSCIENYTRGFVVADEFKSEIIVNILENSANCSIMCDKCVESWIANQKLLIPIRDDKCFACQVKLTCSTDAVLAACFVCDETEYDYCKQRCKNCMADPTEYVICDFDGSHRCLNDAEIILYQSRLAIVQDKILWLCANCKGNVHKIEQLFNFDNLLVT